MRLTTIILAIASACAFIVLLIVSGNSEQRQENAAAKTLDAFESALDDDIDKHDEHEGSDEPEDHEEEVPEGVHPDHEENSIDWRPDMKTARRHAMKQDKPILLLLRFGKENETEEERKPSFISQLVQTNVFSDSRIVNKINESFIPLEGTIPGDNSLNSLKALELIIQKYEESATKPDGFVTSVVINPTGTAILHWSGGIIEDFRNIDSSTNYNPDLYLEFLDESLDLVQKVLDIMKDRSTRLLEKKNKIDTVLKAHWKEVDARYKRQR